MDGFEPDPLNKDHDYLYGLRQSLRRSPHLDMVIGLMAGRGVRFVHVEGDTASGVHWGAIVVQGEPDVAVLRGVAAAIEKRMDDERIRLREDGLKQ